MTFEAMKPVLYDIVRRSLKAEKLKNHRKVLLFCTGCGKLSKSI